MKIEEGIRTIVETNKSLTESCKQLIKNNDELMDLLDQLIEEVQELGMALLVLHGKDNPNPPKA